MPQRLRQPPADPYRKARFRERARDIVAKDRFDRKSGCAVDTAGAVARALERAYKEGFRDAQTTDATAVPREITEDGLLDWRLIPPRPRSAFWTCCLFIFGRRGDQLRHGYLEPDITERGTAGWRLVVAGDDRLEKVMGATTIQPLIKLGLLEPDRMAPRCLAVSDRGRATWERFLDCGGQYPDDLSNF